MSEDAIQLPLLMSIALVAFANAYVFVRWSPKTLMAAWTATLFFVPIWVGAQAGIYYSAITVVTILAIVTSTVHNFNLSIIDVFISSFALLLLCGWALGWILWGHLILALVGWLVPYLGGRLLASRVELRWIYSCLAAGGSVAAVLGIIEFITGINFFVMLKTGNGLFLTWHELQYRGGLLRVEGAFGHSIAFGASLAMCSVFILVAPWPQWLRLLSLLLVTACIVLTFSRIGLGALVLIMVLALFALRREVSGSFRWKVLSLMGAGAMLGFPLINTVFSAAGDEASGSAEYRGNIFSLFDTANILGLAESWQVTASGETFYGNFRSIDSEIVLTALRFGVLPLLLLLAALCGAVLSLIRDRATPAGIAVIGMLPAFAAVAMITQYTTLLWFLGGLAVASGQYASASVTTASRRSSLIYQGEELQWQQQE